MFPNISPNLVGHITCLSRIHLAVLNITMLIWVSAAVGSLPRSQNAALASSTSLHQIPQLTKMARRRIVCSGIVTTLKPLTHSRPRGAGQFSRSVHTTARLALPNGETVKCSNPKNVICFPNLQLHRLTSRYSR